MGVALGCLARLLKNVNGICEKSGFYVQMVRVNGTTHTLIPHSRPRILFLAIDASYALCTPDMDELNIVDLPLPMLPSTETTKGRSEAADPARCSSMLIFFKFTLDIFSTLRSVLTTFGTESSISIP